MKTLAFLLMLLVVPLHSVGAQFEGAGFSREPLAAHHGNAGQVSAAACLCAARVADFSQVPFFMPSSQLANDPWFGTDKVRHFFVSAMLQSLGYGALRALDVRHGGALAGASVVTAGFGVGKELSDRRRGSGVSARDLIWNAAGAGAATLLLVRTER